MVGRHASRRTCVGDSTLRCIAGNPAGCAWTAYSRSHAKPGKLLLAWSRWKPTIYTTIDIIPERIVDARRGPGNANAIAAFSGGVDATFTALRHAKVLPEATRYPLSSILMVHGFDVNVENHDAFNALVRRVDPIISEVQLIGVSSGPIAKPSACKTGKTRSHWSLPGVCICMLPSFTMV